MTVFYEWLVSIALFFGVARGCMWAFAMLTEVEHAPRRPCKGLTMKDEERRTG